MRLDYARALLRAAPLSAIARATARGVRAWPKGWLPPLCETTRLGSAAALARAPRLFTRAPLAEPIAKYFPDAPRRLRARALQILDHQVELFGRTVELGESV